MTPYTIENDVLAILAGPLTAASTSLTLTAAASPMRNPPAPLPGKPGVLTLADRLNNPSKIEIVTYGARTVNPNGTVTLDDLQRGREGTVAQDWAVGAFTYQAPTRDLLQFAPHTAAFNLLVGAPGNVPFFSSPNALSLATSTAFGRSAWGVADAAAFRALIGAGDLQSLSVQAPLQSTGGANPTVSLPNATTAAAGAMSATDKTKLDGIAAGATNTPLATVAPASVAAANLQGTSTQAARADHVHAHGNQAGGNLHANASNVAAGFMSNTDKIKLDGITPGAQPNVPTNLGIGGTAAAPTVTSSTGSSATLPVASGTTAGVTALSSTTPAALGTAAPGTGTTAARADHVHAMPTAAQVGAIPTTHPINPVTALGGTPATVGTANAAGTSTAVARADHVHSHGNQAGGALHAAATSGAAGFMSAADKAKLDGISLAGDAGRIPFLNGSSGLQTSALLRYDTNVDRINARGITIPGLLDLTTLPDDPGNAAAISRYSQSVDAGGVANWEWTVRSGDGLGLIRMRLLSGSAGPEIAFGSGDFGPIWHHENLDPSSIPPLGNTAGAALAASGSAGNAATAARSDHVHPRPTAAEIGAAAASHTHPASQISDSTTAGRALLTAADAAAQRALLNVADGATANATDAQLRDRATHTGSQAASTISDFNASARGQVEATLVAGANITLTPSGFGASRTITIAGAAGGGGADPVFPYEGREVFGLASVTLENKENNKLLQFTRAGSQTLNLDDTIDVEGFQCIALADGFIGEGVEIASTTGASILGYGGFSGTIPPGGAAFIRRRGINAFDVVQLGQTIAVQGSAGALQASDGSGGLQAAGATLSGGALTVPNNAVEIVAEGEGPTIGVLGVHFSTGPYYGNGFAEWGLAHAGNLKTVGGQSLIGGGDIPAGGLSSFTESVSTASPNATVPVVALTATDAATNVDVAISPKGSGSLAAHVADGTSAGGNKRGANSVDWQKSRNNASRVASGSASTISGGISNTASGNQSSVGGGIQNTASGLNSTVAGGTNNSASGSASAISGGDNNAATGSSSWVPGGAWASTRGIYGAHAWSSLRRSVVGDHQHFGMVVQTTTADSSPTSLAANRSSPAGSTVLVLPNNSVWAGQVYVIGRSIGGAVSYTLFSVVAVRGSSAGSTIIRRAQVIDSYNDIDDGALPTPAVPLVSVVSNGVLGSVEVEVEGLKGTTIDWFAEFFGGQIVR